MLENLYGVLHICVLPMHVMLCAVPPSTGIVTGAMPLSSQTFARTPTLTLLAKSISPCYQVITPTMELKNSMI